MERRQGPELGSAAHRTGRRGHVRPTAGGPLPPRLAVHPLAAGPRARVVPLRPARRRQPGGVRLGGRSRRYGVAVVVGASGANVVVASGAAGATEDDGDVGDAGVVTA